MKNLTKLFENNKKGLDGKLSEGRGYGIGYGRGYKTLLTTCYARSPFDNDEPERMSTDEMYSKVCENSPRTPADADMPDDIKELIQKGFWRRNAYEERRLQAWYDRGKEEPSIEEKDKERSSRLGWG